MDSTQLYSGLDSSIQRRLWLLSKLLETVGPEEALGLAERMERFVVDGIPTRAPEAAPRDVAGGDAMRRAAPSDGSWTVMPHLPQATATLSSAPPSPPQEPLMTFVAEPDGAGRALLVENPQPESGRLLSEKDREAFIAALAGGADNDELARRFGITRRQANSLRMGIVKSRPALGSVMPKHVAPKREPLDRKTELQLQEDFLERRRPPPETFDDVIRFLRQRGDEVVRADQDFLVNGTSKLSARQLLERANRKRAELRRPLFAETLAEPRQDSERCVESVNGADLATEAAGNA
jgi:hypothetical protein